MADFTLPSAEEIQVEASEPLWKSKVVSTDDGYGSSIESLTEELSKVKVSIKDQPDKKDITSKKEDEEENEDDEERILQPLQIIDNSTKTSEVQLTSKGPISNGNEGNRYQPYTPRANVQSLFDELEQYTTLQEDPNKQLKIELDSSVEKTLLSKITPGQKEEADRLVGTQSINQLTSTIEPHKDTKLAVLGSQKQMNGQILAQIYSVIKRIISHPDNQVKKTIFKRNSYQISAFEIAAINNNYLVATYLAEVTYNLIDNTNQATKTLYSRDALGNTIIHILARMGDQITETLRSLLKMKLTDGSPLFQVNIPNTKKQLPIHIATQNTKNQPSTIRLLYHAMPQSMEAVDDDGMTPLHNACQRTSDVALIETILSYKKNNINRPRNDGLTALDLINNRIQTQAPGQTSFPIDAPNKEKIIQCLRNNGAKSGVSILPETSILPSPPWSNISSPEQYTDDFYLQSPNTTPQQTTKPVYHYTPDTPVQDQPSDIEEEGARLIYQLFPNINSYIALIDEDQGLEKDEGQDEDQDVGRE